MLEAIAPPEPPQAQERLAVEIRASGPWRGVDVRELWDFRELLYILVWRDLKVRYRQTLLGAAWVMGQPLLTTLIFTLIFNRIARIEVTHLPYPVFALAGVLSWTFFASAVQQASNSLVGNSHLITKVYFPRVLLPAAAVLNALADFAVSVLVMGVLLAWYGIAPAPQIVFAPFVILLGIGLALGLGLWLAALNVKYRDVRVLVPFVFQIWMFATPVVYPLQLVPNGWQTAALANPALGVVEGFRWCLFGGEFPAMPLAVTFAVAIALIATGVIAFRRMEREFVDVI
jgi:lipopolysaccharide transport system permease protein